MRPIDADKLYLVLDNIANHLLEKNSEPESTMGQTIQFVMGIVQDQPDIIHTPNAPLTISELREMDEEPVWISFGFWALVQVTDNIPIAVFYDGSDCAFSSLFNAGFKAYRRRPEEV